MYLAHGCRKLWTRTVGLWPFFCFNMIFDLLIAAQAALQEQQAMERAMMGSMPFGVMSYSFSFS